MRVRRELALNGISSPGFLREGEGEQDTCALIWSAFGMDSAAMGCDDSLDDRKAQAAASRRAGARTVRAIKAVKNVREIGSVDARPRIIYPHGQFFSLCPGSNSHRAARGRMVPGIVQQIEQHLCDAVAIGQYRGVSGAISLCTEIPACSHSGPITASISSTSACRFS